jgi:hypothetical protein
MHKQSTHARSSITLLAASCGLLALSAGCASGPDERPTEEETPAEQTDPTPDLSGRWVSACLPQPQADGSTNYIDLDFDLTADRWALDYVTYGDETCATELVTVHIEGPYELTGASPTLDDVYEARFGFDDKTITPHVTPLADMLNGLDGCGTSAFEVGVSQSVYAAGCPAFGQYPQDVCSADYDLVRLDGDQLTFGNRPADNDMCQPDRRPTELSQLVLSRG